MSFEEKSAWVFAVIATGVSTAYFAGVLGQVGHTPVGEIAYQWSMLKAIGIAVVLSVVGHAVIAATSPEEAGQRDERDADIERHGDYVASFVLVTGALAALGLTMAELEHFWIAQTLYLAFVLTALTAAIAKIVAYRRGL